MIQEFQIALTQEETANHYLLEIHQAPPGVPLAVERIALPIAEWETRLEQLNSDSDRVALGQQLYNALFQGSVASSWKLAQQQNSRLRLRLGLANARLLNLPWELLHTGVQLLVASTEVTFSRYLLSEHSNPLMPTSRQDGGLRVLIAIAGSTPEESSSYIQQAQTLQEELLLEASDIEFTILEQPTSEQLTQVIQQEQYQILHYIGANEHLAECLCNSSIQFVVLEGGNAIDLLNRGCSNVLAFPLPIPDEVSLTLKINFYSYLTQGYPIDFSLSCAMGDSISIYGEKPNNSVFPILYLHPQFDGTFIHQENVADMFDELELDDNYEEDSALVSDLFRQISQSDTTASDADFTDSLSKNDLEEESPVVTVAEVTISSPDRAVAEAEIKQTKKESSFFPLSHKLASPAWVAVALGAIATGGFGMWILQNRTSQPEALVSVETVQMATRSQIDFETADTAAIAKLAMEKCSRGELPMAAAAVTELLDRNALPQASAALAVIPQSQLNTHSINFLRGRLAWQSVSNNHEGSTIKDAQRFLEMAIQDKPDSAQYQNALGFVYYQQGDFDRAIQVWFDALSFSEHQQAAGMEEASSDDALNAYAGLALAMRQAAAEQSESREKKLVYEAVKLSSKVITEDPVNFQPEALTQNWMWSDKAIQDWRSLLASS